MPLTLFNRRRKVTSMLPSAREAETITLRVLVDSGPAARDMFVIRVPADDDVSAIRTAVAAQIGIPSMCLFKVAIPWEAQYQASAYGTQFGIAASLLSVFPGWNLDDPSQLGTSGGADFPAYITGSGSLRARKRSSAMYPQALDVTIRHWFPEGSTADEINILVRTASSSSLDWARPVSTPITLSCRFTQDRRRRAGLGPLPPPSFKSASETVLVDVAPEATVAELKVALLLAANRPAPAGLLDAIVLWRVEMTEPELQAVELSGGLSRGRRPSPYPPHSTPPLFLGNDNARIGDYLPNFRSQRGNPSNITLSAWINPVAVDALAPRFTAPRFQYPMPDVVPPRTQPELRSLPFLGFDSPTPPTSDLSGNWDNSFTSTLEPPTPRCCSSGHEGFGMGSGGLIGLGIFMSPTSSISDHGSSDDEAFSWPPTPIVGGGDDEAKWLGPSPTAPAWRHKGDEMPADLEQAATPRGFAQSFPFSDNILVL